MYIITKTNNTLNRKYFDFRNPDEGNSIVDEMNQKKTRWFA